MLRKWFAIFKKDTLMDRAYRRSFLMFDIIRGMFATARESLRVLNAKFDEMYLIIW